MTQMKGLNGLHLCQERERRKVHRLHRVRTVERHYLHAISTGWTYKYLHDNKKRTIARLFLFSRPSSITASPAKATKLPPPAQPQRALRGGGGRGQQRQQGVPLLVAHALGPAPRAAQDRAADRQRGRRQAQVQEGQAGAIQVR